jgi:hypothetical protein
MMNMNSVLPEKPYDALIATITSTYLTLRFGKGLSRSNLMYVRQLYKYCPKKSEAFSPIYIVSQCRDFACNFLILKNIQKSASLLHLFATVQRGRLS